MTVPRKAPPAYPGTAAPTTGSAWSDAAPACAAGVPDALVVAVEPTGDALTVDDMLPCCGAGWESASAVSVAVGASLPEGVVAADGVLAGAAAPAAAGLVEGWTAVGGVESLGVDVPGAGEPGLSGGGSLGGVTGGVTGGVEVGGPAVGSGSVVDGGVVGGGAAAGVGGGAVGVGVGVLQPTCCCGEQGAGAIAGAGGSAIDTLGASIIVATCRRPAPAIAHIHRCARQRDMHVLKLILRAPKFAADTPT